MADYSLFEAVKKAYEAAPNLVAAIANHEAKANAHPISGVAGLREELDALADLAGESGDIQALDARLTVVEGTVATLEQRKSTCLVNAVGTGAPHETVATQLPANIAINSRYVIPNPFGNNTPVICWAEVFVSNKWSDPGFIYDSASGGGYGTKATFVQGEGVIVQTGNARVCTSSIYAGGGHGNTALINSAPCRVFVRKLEA